MFTTLCKFGLGFAVLCNAQYGGNVAPPAWTEWGKSKYPKSSPIRVVAFSTTAWNKPNLLRYPDPSTNPVSLAENGTVVEMIKFDANHSNVYDCRDTPVVIDESVYIVGDTFENAPCQSLREVLDYQRWVRLWALSCYNGEVSSAMYQNKADCEARNGGEYSNHTYRFPNWIADGYMDPPCAVSGKTPKVNPGYAATGYEDKYRIAFRCKEMQSGGTVKSMKQQLKTPLMVGSSTANFKIELYTDDTCTTKYGGGAMTKEDHEKNKPGLWQYADKINRDKPWDFTSKRLWNESVMLDFTGKLGQRDADGKLMDIDHPWFPGYPAKKLRIDRVLCPSADSKDQSVSICFREGGGSWYPVQGGDSYGDETCQVMTFHTLGSSTNRCFKDITYHGGWGRTAYKETSSAPWGQQFPRQTSNDKYSESNDVKTYEYALINNHPDLTGNTGVAQSPLYGKITCDTPTDGGVPFWWSGETGSDWWHTGATGGGYKESTTTTTANAGDTSSGGSNNNNNGNANTNEGSQDPGTTVAATTPSVPASTTVYGSVNIELASAADFLADNAAQDAVREGFAEAAGVVKSYVALTFNRLRRRLAESSKDARRLADTVQVSYTITIPSSASVTAADVQSTLSTKPVADITSIVSAKVQAVKGANYSIAVTAKSAVQQGSVTTTNGMELQMSLTARPTMSSCAFFVAVATAIGLLGQL